MQPCHFFPVAKRPAALNNILMLAFVSRAGPSGRQVQSYQTKGYFEKFPPAHKGTTLSKQKPTTGTKRVGRVRSLTSTTIAGQLF